MKHTPVRELGPTRTLSPANASDEFLQTNPSRRYLLVSPCRDEAQYLRRTLDSVAAAVGAAGALGGRRRRIDRRDPGDPGGICPPAALPARGATHRSRPPPGGTGRHRGLLRRPRSGAPGGLRLPLQARHGSRPAGSLLRAADGADGKQSAHRHHLRQAVVRSPAERRAGAGGLRRRDVGRHDQVLPGRLLQGDRRLRAPGDVGRHRLPPRAHARLDRRERRSTSRSASSTCARRAPARRASGPGGFGPGSASTSWAPRRSTIWPWPSTACRRTRC